MPAYATPLPQNQSHSVDTYLKDELDLQELYPQLHKEMLNDTETTEELFGV